MDVLDYLELPKALPDYLEAALDYLERVLDYLSSRQIIYGGSRLSRVAKCVARLSTAVKSRS